MSSSLSMVIYSILFTGQIIPIATSPPHSPSPGGKVSRDFEDFDKIKTSGPREIFRSSNSLQKQPKQLSPSATARPKSARNTTLKTNSASSKSTKQRAISGQRPNVVRPKSAPTRTQRQRSVNKVNSSTRNTNSKKVIKKDKGNAN